jgi:outer membrane protein OmpA-like peptidoglycan-associated protein
MPAKPMLDDVELQHVQKVEAEDEQVLAQHAVPVLEGDFLQDLGRRVTRITLVGVMVGPEAGEQLKTLRLKFRNAEPVSFVSDISTATTVDKVLIEEFGVRELAGKPARFEFTLTLREFLPPPPPEQEEPPPPPPPPEPELPDVETGKLVVQVIVEGQPDFDFGKLSVTAEVPQEDGPSLSRTLVNRENNIWTEEGLPPGEYTIKAVEANPEPVVGTTKASVLPGQTAQAQLTVQAGSLIAKQLIVHFRTDRSFVEPCMRAVLRRAALHAKSNSKDKLLIVGHTDKVDTPAYNQSLSERRARSVFAYLTFGRDRDAALAEWNLLRQARPKGELPSVKDNWGLPEAQYMLQDLGFYPGRVDGKEGDLTRDAVSAFRCQKGLRPGTDIDDDVLNALIKDYLAQDALALDAGQFFPNARDACSSGIVKWVGCGEKDPVKNVGTAFRQSRRVELLFVSNDKLPPCDVTKPVTFELPPPTVTPPPTWCLDPDKKGTECCFVVPVLAKAGTKPKEGQWTRTPLEPGTITVEGSITREDGKPLSAANRKIALITATGEIKAGERSNGDPEPALAGADGKFKFADKPVGVYSVEIQDDVLIRLDTQKASDTKGNSVCKTLTSSDFRLDIVILRDPVLREIKLPVVAHLMTALHPTTRAVRTCSDTFTPGPPQPQKTARQAQDVRDLFDGANEVWRQARIHFDLVDIVEEAYADPAHLECAVGDQEFATLLFNSSYPDSINVFFFGTLESTGEAGMDLSAEFFDDAGNVIRRVEGCALGDKVRLQIFVNANPILVEPDKEQSITILSHELGHHLSLGQPDHPEDTPANEGRLMLGSVEAGNRRLIKEEVKQARKAPNTASQCQPLKLRVTGATQIGGTRSFDFITFQGAGQVTIDALVDGSTTIDKGTVTMTGGQPGTNPGQQTVATTSTGINEIVGAYTPTGSTVSVTARVRIRVVTFSLRVEGAQPNAPGSTTFVARRQPNQVATVIVDLSSRPFMVPKTMVTWDKGDEVADPLRRAVSVTNIAQTTVTATIGTTSRSVKIVVVEVVVTRNSDPFGAAINQVQMEGILDKDLSDIDVGDLFSTQSNSLFRLRADIPGLAAGVTQLSGTMTSTAPGGAAVETIAITLRRTPLVSDTFLSLPLLAIPSAIPAAEINLKTPATLNVIRARSTGKLTLSVNSPVSLGNLGVVEVTDRARALVLFAQALANSAAGIDSDTTLADLQRKIARVARIWAQAGIEVQTRRVAAPVESPATLLDVEHTDNTGTTLTPDEQRLCGKVIIAGDPTRSAIATDLNVFYVRSLDAPPAPAADPSGIAYPNDPVIVLEGGTKTKDEALAHEIGHQIITWGGLDEHKDLTGTNWPSTNVLHQFDTGGGELDRTQVVDILASTNAGTNRFLVFQP